MTTNTASFFNTIGMSSNSLHLSVENWPQIKSFCIAKRVVNNFKVINDVAERGVKLMEDYNKLLTNNEEQKQYLLQGFSDYRKKLNDKPKRNIIATVTN